MQNKLIEALNRVFHVRNIAVFFLQQWDILRNRIAYPAVGLQKRSKFLMSGYQPNLLLCLQLLSKSKPMD